MNIPTCRRFTAIAIIRALPEQFSYETHGSNVGRPLPRWPLGICVGKVNYENRSKVHHRDPKANF